MKKFFLIVVGSFLFLFTFQSILAFGKGVVLISNSNRYNSIARIENKMPSSLTNVTILAEGATSFCKGESVLLKVEIVTDLETELTYQWKKNNQDIDSATSSKYMATSSGEYSLVVSDGLSFFKSSNSLIIEVYSAPSAVANAVGLTTVCYGRSVFINADTALGMRYQWLNGSTAIKEATNSTFETNSRGNYSVEVTNNYGCSNTSNSIDIIVNPLPLVKFEIFPNIICGVGVVSFINQSENSSTLEWVFDNGKSSNLENPEILFDKVGSYSAKLISTSFDNCMDSLTQSFSVFGKPEATFSVKSGCVNEKLSFISNSLGSLTHEWFFGDLTTSSIANPEKVYSKSGVYDVQLIITDVNGCKDTAKSIINAYPLPMVSFNMPDNVCEGTSISFKNTTTLAYGEILHQWSFGNGKNSIEINPTYVYESAGNYKVLLTSTTEHACMASYESNIIVNGKPMANFIAKPVCQGQPTIFTNTSIGGTSYLWDFGNNLTSTASSPTHIYALSGNYVINLTVSNSNNCTEKITKDVLIYSNPLVNFIAPDNCAGIATVFINNSSDDCNMYWQFGDGHNSSVINPTYTYSNSGNYNVKLSVKSADGCISALNKLITIFPVPITAFSINNNSQCLYNHSFIYTDYSTISNGSLTREWTLGDGVSSSDASIIKTYSQEGKYLVKLVTTSDKGCTSSVSDVVVVYPNPKANFSINNPSQCFNGNLFTYKDESTISNGSLISLWKLGDGYDASGINVIKKYNEIGLYKVKLYTASEFGCIDSIVKNISVNPSPVASFTVLNENQCLNENNFILRNTSIGGPFNSLWQLGDGSISNMSNTIHTYANAGNYKVVLKVKTLYGCNDSIYYTLNVLPNPSNLGIEGPVSVNNGSLQTYSIPLNLGSIYNWSVTNGSIVSQGSNKVQIKWGNTGLVGILQVIETNNNGCSGIPSNYNVALAPMSGAIGNIKPNTFVAYLYPNPSKEYFTVVVSTNELMNLTVYDHFGKEVMTNIQFNSSITISDTHFGVGIYILRISNSNGNATLLRMEVKN